MVTSKNLELKTEQTQIDELDLPETTWEGCVARIIVPGGLYIPCEEDKVLCTSMGINPWTDDIISKTAAELYKISAYWVGNGLAEYFF